MTIRGWHHQVLQPHKKPFAHAHPNVVPVDTNDCFVFIDIQCFKVRTYPCVHDQAQPGSNLFFAPC